MKQTRCQAGKPDVRGGIRSTSCSAECDVGSRRDASSTLEKRSGELGAAVEGRRRRPEAAVDVEMNRRSLGRKFCGAAGRQQSHDLVRQFARGL